MFEFSSAGDISAFRQQQFPCTIQNALRTRFYTAKWRGLVAGGISHVDELATLPIVTRREVQDAGPNAQVDDGEICDESFTRGSRSSKALLVVRSRREQDEIRSILGAQQSQRRRRAIRFVDYFHGHRVSLPSDLYCHRLGIYDRGAFARALEILAGSVRHHDMVQDHCSVIIGLERCLRAFAAHCERSGCEPFRSLDYVVSYGDWLSPRWRRRFEDAWGCVVVDRYSLAEIFGGATENSSTGWWEFDPWLLPEVVEPGTGRTIRTGIGLLVLTVLTPFQVSQPMVRYLTEDVVLVREFGPGVADIAIKPLGRACDGILAPDGITWILTPNELQEVVDELGPVSRMPLFLDSPDVQDHHGIGPPRYSIDRESGPNHDFQVAITLSHSGNATERAHLARQVSSELARRSAARLGENRLRVQIRILEPSGS